MPFSTTFNPAQFHHFTHQIYHEVDYEGADPTARANPGA
jgi:hypothetical protein